MTKINVRSPYYVQATYVGAVHSSVNIYVWSGDENNRGVVSYEITKDVISSSVTVEISELVRDYLNLDIREYFGIATPDTILSSYITRVGSDGGEYEGSTCLSDITSVLSTQQFTDAVWVEVEIQFFDSIYTLLDTQTFSYLAVDGYGYFEEGINANLSTTLLQSNTNIYIPTGEDPVIPVYIEDVGQVKFYNNSILVDTINISASTFSKDQIEYVTTTSTVDYAEVITFPSGSPVISDTLNIYYVDECRYEPYKVTFINKFGAIQDLWFYKKSIESLNTSSEQYKSNSLDIVALEYSIQNHQYKQFLKQGKESVVMNTGFVPESFNEVVKQLLLSEQVWTTKDINGTDTVLPVIPKTPTLQYKTSVNDRLINYTIDFEYAFDKINNIR